MIPFRKIIFTASSPFSFSITEEQPWHNSNHHPCPSFYRENLDSKIKVPAALGLAVVDADAIDIIFKTGQLWYRV